MARRSVLGGAAEKRKVEEWEDRARHVEVLDRERGGGIERREVALHMRQQRKVNIDERR